MKKKKNIILVSITILIIVIVLLIISFKNRKVIYNSCDGITLVEWASATGALEYGVCLDKKGKSMFISPNEAFEHFKEERENVLNYIENKAKLKTVSNKNYNKYVDFCKNNINEDHEFYNDCVFMIEFFKVYSNNFLKK
ncbi:MAG: hypothetical protein K2M17_02890 [Bacilli bacterium]|nr:hypothetical protein [Bacilli bacterium]